MGFTFEKTLSAALRIGWRGQGQMWKQEDGIQVTGAGGSQQVLEAGEQVVEFRDPLMGELSGGDNRIVGLDV